MPEFMEEITTTIPIIAGRGRNKQVIAHAIVLDDPFTNNVLKKQSWFLHNKETAAPSSSVKIPGKGSRPVGLHHQIYRHYNAAAPDGRFVRHRDGNKLNCLPDNLEPCTRSELNARKPRQVKNTSGFRGVVEVNQGRHHCWLVQVQKRRKRLYRKPFPFTEQGWREAAQAVNEVYLTHYPDVPTPNPDYLTKPYPH
jgi:hypothetical protein